MSMEGVVIKKNANLFSVEDSTTKKVVRLQASGKTQESGIFVGDRVFYSDVIEKVFDRKNILIRPPLANLDKLFIVLAPLPKPDFVLVDKLIVYCFIKGVQPILVVNKIDKAHETFVKNIKKIYNKIAKCLFVSAKSNQIDQLSNQIEGICAFAGQSAVGKSSLINCLFSQHIAQVGDVSKKIERGKQTTRMVQLFPYSKGYIADTAGFSMLDLSFVTDLEPRELSAYYPDFLSARAECKYRSCLHEAGSDCGVIKAIEKNQISQERYQNYLKILRELKDRKKY